MTEIFGEGLRIPPLRLISRGALNADLEKLILANVRTPDERKGDLGAQLAATLRATERLKALAQRYGGAELIAYMAQVMDYSERLMRAALHRPAGRRRRVRGLLRWRRHRRRRSRQGCAVLASACRVKKTGGPADRRLRRHRRRRSKGR